MKCAIIGKGKVGIATDLTLKLNADFHDPLKGCFINNFTPYDKVIICVNSLNNGPFDHQAVEECLSLLAQQQYQGVVAIRCTASPHFLKAWEVRYKLNLIHFPEFMKQSDGHYLDKPWVVVIGGKQQLTEPFGEWLMEKRYGTRNMLLLTTITESGLIKLYQNAGLAMKVVFANLMYEACQEIGGDYEKVRRGVTADWRVGPGHTTVPGEDGFGFSGHCLPKDTNCLAASCNSHGFWDKILEINTKLRMKNGQ